MRGIFGSEFVDAPDREATEAAAGKIMRRGKPVAQITAVQTARKRIDLSTLRALTDAMPVQRESARDLVRRLRDQDAIDALFGHVAARCSPHY
jgi:antitoxin (DNA-binding transcriptional repressor) of toxin-antitoxin stability system